MKVKITIEKDTEAAKVINDYLESKKAFREATEEGQLKEYIEKKKFATPLQPLPAQ